MSSKKLSKLQIRAEILAAIQHLYSFDDVPRTIQDKYLESIKLIEDRSYVIEILIKELLKYDYKKSRIISVFFIELAELEQVNDLLWSYIKDPKISDEVKDLLIIILSGLGDETDPEEYLSYFDNPSETIEKETERLLEISYVNPEAQVDFMDFMFALPVQEQMTLIYSLKDDYPGEYLANVLLTCINADLDDEVKKVIVEVLGETKTAIGVPVLKEILDSSTDLLLKKTAKKSLNTLKIAGIDIDKPVSDLRGIIICERSKIHECYVSCIDGMGNQGIIVSRIKSSGDIIMFSVVINDCDGIIDCFGFNGISSNDFGRIVAKFQENSTRVPVNPEYCKYKLDTAQKINKKNSISIPYEYLAWSALIHDFPEINESIENVASKWGNVDLVDQSENLFKYSGFKYWFLDDNDHEMIKTFLNNIIDQTIKNRDYFFKNNIVLSKWLDEEITNIIKEYFDKSIVALYRKRLLDTAYLLNFQGLPNFRNMVSAVAQSLACDNINIYDIPFFRKLIKKTIFEGYVRFQYDLTKDKSINTLVCLNNNKQPKEVKKEVVDNSESDLSLIINMLEATW